MGLAQHHSAVWLRWSGPLLIGFVVLMMLKLTWLTWPDPIIDFGRELYVPWRILEGQTLYTEIAYHNGPLSPWVNSSWFRLSGVSLISLVRLNLLILAGVIWLLYRMLQEVAGRGAATLGCVTFAVLFGFGQFVGVGNYNWLCPYSHEMTHGIALSLLAVYLVGRYAERGVLWNAAASGLVTGLVFLTKAEVFVAAAAAAGMGMLLAVWAEGRRGTATLGPLLVWAGAAVVPAAVATVLLALAMPFGEALRGVAGSWVHVFAGGNVESPFFRAHSGTGDISGNVLEMLTMVVGYALVLTPLGLLALFNRGSSRARIALAVTTAAASGLVLAVFRQSFPWITWLRPLPLVMLGLFLTGLVLFVRQHDERAAAGRRVLRLALILFAALMLLKMVLNVWVGHYGFGLAALATVLLLVTLVDWVPRMIDRRGGHGWTFAAAVVVLWVGVLAIHTGIIQHSVSRKTNTIGEGADVFRADRYGVYLDKAIRLVNREVGSDQTLTTFIDCEMLNYQTRRRNPVPYGNFNPHQLSTFGEQNMLQALEQSPPDYVAIVHANTSEYGARFFGKDYGLDLWNWIGAHYRDVAAPIGSEPMQGDGFGIVLKTRRELESP